MTLYCSPRGRTGKGRGAEALLVLGENRLRLHFSVWIKQLQVACKSLFEGSLEFQSSIDVLLLEENLPSLLGDFAHPRRFCEVPRFC